MTGKEVSAKLKERGVLSNAISEHQMRMLTHFDVTAPNASGRWT